MSRRCEILTSGQYWRTAPVTLLQVGDVFRLFLDSEPVTDGEGCWRWRVVAPPVPNLDGTHDVDAEAVPETEIERAVRTGGMYWPGRRDVTAAEFGRRSRLKA